MARNEEQDPGLERELREYYSDQADDLRAPGDLWQRLESQLGEQKDPFSLSAIGGKLLPRRGTFWNPTFAGGTVAAVALVATVSVWSATNGFGGEQDPSQSQSKVRTLFVTAEVEVTRIVTEPGEVMEVEATTVVVQEAMDREVTAVVQEVQVVTRAVQAPTGVPQPDGIQGPQGIQGPGGSTGPMGDRGPQGPQEPSGQQGSTGQTGSQGPQGQWSSARGTSEVQPPVPPPDTSFADYGRQSFVSAREDNVSTFSLDTDRTSYQLALNWARNGYEIDPSSVRAEEWVNAFNYNYDPPRNDREFAVTSDVIQHPLDADLHLARVSFQAPVVHDDTPLNVTLVLDASGSMAQGNRVDIAREAADAIRQSLGPRDRIAVVHFTNDVIDEYTVWHSDPDSGHSGWSISQLTPQGSTNVQAGLDLGVRLADQARRERPDAHNYIILMSDGVANVDATDPFAILESAYDRDSRNPLRIIAIGVGIENYNDDLLEKLAQHGNGWYRYLQDTDQARATFSRENWLAISTPFADQTRAQLTWDTDVVDAWRIVGYENRVTPDHTFTQDRKEFAELPSGTATTVFYELDLRRDMDPDRWHDLGDVELRWVEPGSGGSRRQHANVTGWPGASFEAVDPLLWLGAVVSLTADRYSSLDEGYSNPAWVASDLRTLNDLLATLRSELGSLQAYEDLRYLMEHMLAGIDHYAPRSTPPTGYSP